MELANDSITFNDHIRAIGRAENILYPLIAVLGIVANAFVILVIGVTERSRSNRTVANTFVMNLAIADIMFLIMLPFHMPLWHENGYPYPDAMCTVLEVMKHISYHSSILFLTGMSTDRYMAIVHSLKSLQYRTQRNARIACAVLWLLSILTSVPIIIFTKLQKYDNEDGTTSNVKCSMVFPGYENKSGFVPINDLYAVLEDYDHSGNIYYDDPDGNDTSYFPDDYYNHHNASMHESYSPRIQDEHFCTYPSAPTPFRVWQWFTFVTFFLLPVLAIFFCYYKIWRATTIRKIRSESRKLEGNQERQSLQPHRDQSKQSWKKIQSKVTIMVAVLVSAFVLGWLPFQIWILLKLSPGIKVSKSHHCDVINVVVIMLAWSNSLVNPILYSITSENFRKRTTTTLFFLRYGYRSAQVKRYQLSLSRTAGNNENVCYAVQSGRLRVQNGKDGCDTTVCTTWDIAEK